MKKEQKTPSLEVPKKPAPSLDDLYRKKGELATVMEVAQQELQAINGMISQKLQEMRAIPQPSSNGDRPSA